ncbi:MAG: hypothetical protein ACO4AM_07850, partial [Candidatus Nanopelagicaceae bacterium]
TMSLALPSQILLTSDAYLALQKSARLRLPKDVRTACVGVYKFKGVRDPMVVYAIAVEHKYLQPPPGSDKVVRVGGPKYIKKLARDRKLKDYLIMVYQALIYVGTLFTIFVSYHVLRSELLLSLLGIYNDVYWLHVAAEYIGAVIGEVFR